MVSHKRIVPSSTGAASKITQLTIKFGTLSEKESKVGINKNDTPKSKSTYLT